MQALVYRVNPIGWATCRWLRYLWEGCLRSRLSGLALREVPVPDLPGDDWVRLQTLLGGICGTDVAILAQKQPPDSILQAFSSLPAVLGHENVAVVVETGAAVDPSWKGRRVCVEPTLCCAVRGIDPPCDRCAAGEFGACENFGAAGIGAAKLPPGSSQGYNRRTGGSFAEFFVAHRSQLVAAPQELSDELAVLTDPVACGLHAVLRTDLSSAARVLVYGTGMLGLALIACLRAVGYQGRIDALDRAGHAAALATTMGADAAVRLPAARSGRAAEIARRTGATMHRVRFGNYMLSGGYDVVFDLVGSPRSIQESLKWTRARGQVVMAGTGHGGNVDLTPVWFRELELRGAYGRQVEDYGGRRISTYELVHEFMRAGKLDVRELLTHAFALRDYRQALDVAMHKDRYAAIKVAFDFRPGRAA